MKKTWVFNIALSIISTVISLVFAEFLLRYMLFSDHDKFESIRDPAAYSINLKDNNENFFTEDYWKLNHQFRNGNNIETPQPILGWWGLFNQVTLEHLYHRELKDRRPVLLYGDSFARCVDSVLCFEEILNSDTLFSSRYYLLNYGVGGFGVDQICILFEETVESFDNPFVIISILTTDLDRSMLSFRDAQKPIFRIKDGILKLDGVPIKLSTKEYINQNPPQIFSYLFNRLRNSRINPFEQSEEKYRTYIEKIKLLNESILERILTNLKTLDLDYLFLIFQPEHHSLPDWRLTFLLNFCDEHEVPYICDLDIRKNDSTYTSYDPHRYAIKGDGHPTSYLNRLIVCELKCIIGNDN